MVKLRTRSVFVPGGQPEHTYVSRKEYGFEDDIRAASDNLCKLVTVTGPTKSGKSVLTKRIFPKDIAVWIDGGSVAKEDDAWSQVIQQLGGHTSTTKTTEVTRTKAGGGELGISGGVFATTVSGKATGSYSKADKEATATTQTTTLRSVALEALRQSGTPIIIDDFHYLEQELQGSIVRALKALVFDGHPAILLAIPHRRYDAIRVEREMTGRVQPISIPAWSVDELRKIPNVGLPLLNTTVDDGLIELFVAEALGSPHLVQEFFRELMIKTGIQETADALVHVERPEPSAQALLSQIATQLSRPVFEMLAKGPRQRSDRTQRPFRDGRHGDIYVAVLNAIARIKPGTGPVEYEQIRGVLRDLLEDLPDAHEVSRVLDHMSKIQATEGGSAPVLDWDKRSRRLHITDPYFAFFLKWGADIFTAGSNKNEIDNS